MSFLPVNNKISTLNSSNSPLGGGGVFPGSAEDITAFGIIIVTVFSDVASATDGLNVLFSSDGVNWDGGDQYTVPANTQKTFSFQAATQYYKVEYTNGGGAQSIFRLQTKLNQIYVKPSSHRVQDDISSDDDAELMKSIISAEIPTGEFRNIKASREGNLLVSLQESKDAFGRLRVSQPFSIFDNSFTSDQMDGLFWSELTNGTGSSAYDRSNAKYTLSVAANGDYVVRQTRQRFKYKPGDAHQILLTGVLSTETNIRKRAGYVDYDNVNLATITNAPQNGIFFENNAGVLSWNICKNGVITETVTQANWSVDPLDGSDPSGFTLDIDDTNIFFMDMQWLGVGTVRCGFVIDGEIIICHEFHHASNDFTDVYMRTANLPVAFEITATGVGTGTSTQICTSVISEGGFNPTGLGLTVRNDANIAIDDGDIELLVGLRLRAENFEFSIVVEKIKAWNNTSVDVFISLVLNPTYSGTPTWSNLANSNVQVGYNNNNVVSDVGLLIDGDFINDTGNQANSSASDETSSTLRLGKGLDDSLDEIWLIAEPNGGAASIRGLITFRDFF